MEAGGSDTSKTSQGEWGHLVDRPANPGGVPTALCCRPLTQCTLLHSTTCVSLYLPVSPYSPHLAHEAVQHEVILELVVLPGVGAKQDVAHGAEVGLATNQDAAVNAVVAVCGSEQKTGEKGTE